MNETNPVYETTTEKKPTRRKERNSLSYPPSGSHKLVESQLFNSNGMFSHVTPQDLNIKFFVSRCHF